MILIFNKLSGFINIAKMEAKNTFLDSLVRFMEEEDVGATADIIRRTLGFGDNGAEYDDMYSVISFNLLDYHFLLNFNDFNQVGRRVYSSPQDRDTMTRIRGVVVAIDSKGVGSIISRGYPFTPTCVIKPDQVSIGNFDLTDVFGFTHRINPAKMVATLGFDGTILRVSRYNGKSFISTNKNLDPRKSHWGNSPNFVDIYNDFGGPELSSLFDPKFKSSNITHTFMLVHPALQCASRVNIGKGYLTYLGTLKNDHNNKSDQIEQVAYTEWQKNHSLIMADNFDAEGNPTFPCCSPTTEETVGKNIFFGHCSYVWSLRYCSK